MILEGHWYAVKGESFDTNDIEIVNFLIQLDSVALHIDRVNEDRVLCHTVNRRYMIIKKKFYDYLYELKNDGNEWDGWK